MQIGQRADVIVVGLPGATGAYWIRSTMGSCSATTQPNALGIAYYTHDALNNPPTTEAWPDNTDPCANVSIIFLLLMARSRAKGFEGSSRTNRPLVPYYSYANTGSYPNH
jgi:hypothetical protein